MQYVTSIQAKNNFGEIVDTSQREPVIVTRHNRPMSAVISIAGDIQDMRLQFAKLLSGLKPLRGEEAVAAYREAVAPIRASVEKDGLSEADILELLKSD